MYSELEVREQLLSDVIDHEGRLVLLAELAVCACGSAEGYALPNGEITCAGCAGYRGAVDVSELARRRWQRRLRREAAARRLAS